MLADPIGLLGRRLEDIVDESVGIVRRVYEVPREAGAADFFHYAARAADTAAFGGPQNFGNTGGASVRREIAIAKAVGEAIERYSAALYAAERLPLVSYAEADFPCVRPETFALHSQAQYDAPGFPWAPFDDDAPIRWTPALDLANWRVVYVPAAFTWIPYRFDQAQGETPIGQPISTGLACHESWARSALGGLCEAIERDAFTLMWQRQLSLPQIRVETLSDANYDLVQRFERTGDRVRLINLTTDLGVPVVLSVLRSEAAGRPAHVFAASADPDPEQAVLKALEELAHTRRYAQQVLQWMPCPSVEDDWAEVETQAHHLRLAADPQTRALYDFVFASRERIDFEDLPAPVRGDAETRLAAVARALATAGLSTYVADLTSPDVRGLGLSVTRTLAPGLNPLFMGHRLRALGGRRLSEAPARYAQAGLPADGALNPLPHPYP